MSHIFSEPSERRELGSHFEFDEELWLLTSASEPKWCLVAGSHGPAQHLPAEAAECES